MDDLKERLKKLIKYVDYLKHQKETSKKYGNKYEYIDMEINRREDEIKEIEDNLAESETDDYGH